MCKNAINRVIFYLTLLFLIKNAQPDCCCYSTCAVRVFLPHTADVHLSFCWSSLRKCVFFYTNWPIYIYK